MQVHNFVFTVSILQCLVIFTTSDQEKDTKSASISNDKDHPFPELPMINSITTFSVDTENSKYVSGPNEDPATAQSGIELGE